MIVCHRKSWPDTNTGQLFSAVLLFAAVPELFAVVDESSAVAGGKDHFLSEAWNTYSAVWAVDKFQAVHIRIVQAQRERIDEKSDLTFLSEQDGVCKHTEMDEARQRLALRPVFVNIGDLLNQHIFLIEIYPCADFLQMTLPNSEPLSAVWQHKQISQNSEKVQMNLKKCVLVFVFFQIPFLMKFWLAKSTTLFQRGQRYLLQND